MRHNSLPLEMTDHDLMRRTAKGDFEAFEHLVRKHQRAVINLAYRFLGDHDEAEDVAQEVFLRVFEAAGRYDERATFKTWLFTIAKRLCFDRVRKRKPEYLDELPETPGDSMPDGQLETKELEEFLRRAIASLPENQRMALLLQHFEGLSYDEVARVIGVTRSAVESLLVRAKHTLRKRLSPITSSGHNVERRRAGI